MRGAEGAPHLPLELRPARFLWGLQPLLLPQRLQPQTGSQLLRSRLQTVPWQRLRRAGKSPADSLAPARRYLPPAQQAKL
jgi:hypothetical protein